MARKKAAKPVTPGLRTGTKKSDFRWTAPDGTIWGSRFEFQIYTALKEQGYDVRKTTAKDSMAYASPAVGGRCLQCGSGDVVKDRTYTPDLFVSQKSGHVGPDNERAGYYLEAKGYLRGPRRALLRHFRKARPDVDLRLAIQRDYRVGKGSLVSWAAKYLKVPVCIWQGSLPNEWK